ncbi:hypothetical protein AB6F57_04305 [Providencia hangzhouensis]|uniref:hypothetical protein n=1 Tax=Providencia hangzhouensis TaxID=3031799 RepID=UPI0034DD1379
MQGTFRVDFDGSCSSIFGLIAVDTAGPDEGKGTQQPAPPNNVTPKEIEAGWNYIFQSLTPEEKHRVISTFNRGGLQALFAEGIIEHNEDVRS